MIDLHFKKQLNGSDGALQLDIKAHLEKGDFLAIYGPSGAGKTSLLRLLAGLLPADAGEIIVDGEVWLGPQRSKAFSTQQRSIGMLFQDYALFPHLNVENNLKYALQKTQDTSIIDELIEVMELDDLRYQKPALLSGGQQQRVALARALILKPKLLLLDEPLAAVDQAMRLKLQTFIQRVHREYGLTTIMVSHDKAEVIRLANRVMILEAGKVVQSGTPEEVFGVTDQLVGTVVRFEGDRMLVLVGDQLTWVDKQVGTEIGNSVPLR